MKTVLLINISNYGSTGNIMRGISKAAEQNGFVCWQAYAPDKKNAPKAERDIIISPYNIRRFNELYSRFTGMRGFQAYFSTKVFLRKIDKIKPDIIHLHNLHNNYIHVGLLFDYIKENHIKVIWTLHDCWAFTGRCPHFQISGCERWKTGCHDCPYPKEEYPSARLDRTKILWKMKKAAFTGVNDMTIATPSKWLADLVKESFLSEYPVKVINNGIDLTVFKPTESDFKKVFGLEGKILVLTVALGWDKRKGYGDLLELAKILDDSCRIVLVGVSKEQIDSLPSKILGIERTNSPKELAEIYSVCDVFVNTTYEDNYPTVNLEARACGLPVVTYRTGGSPESAGDDAVLVEVGDIHGMKLAIEKVIGKKKKCICSEELSAEEMFAEYIELYDLRGGGDIHP